MEQDGQAHEGQPQQAQHDQQGGVGSNPQQNPQEQAKVASQEAVVAQQEAQEAIKRAYVKQMAAQEKAERASQQVVTEQETAKKVATEAASEAAEKAANEQRERGAKEAHDMSIANLAAQSALASLSASQSANQQRPVNPGYQSGFVAYSSRDQNSASATQGQGGNLGIPAVFIFPLNSFCIRVSFHKLITEEQAMKLRSVRCTLWILEASSKGSRLNQAQTAIPCNRPSVVNKCYCKVQIRWRNMQPPKWQLLRTSLPVHQILNTSRWQGSKQRLLRTKWSLLTRLQLLLKLQTLRCKPLLPYPISSTQHKRTFQGHVCRQVQIAGAFPHFVQSLT